jgi:hypothetical protein
LTHTGFVARDDWFVGHGHWDQQQQHECDPACDKGQSNAACVRTDSAPRPSEPLSSPVFHALTLGERPNQTVCLARAARD